MCNKSAIEALKNQGSIVYNCSLVHKVYRKKGCDYRSNEQWSVYRTKSRFVFWAPSKGNSFFWPPYSSELWGFLLCLVLHKRFIGPFQDFGYHKSDFTFWRKVYEFFFNGIRHYAAVMIRSVRTSRLRLGLRNSWLWIKFCWAMQTMIYIIFYSGLVFNLGGPNAEYNFLTQAYNIFLHLKWWKISWQWHTGMDKCRGGK